MKASVSLELVVLDCDGVLVDSEWVRVGVEVRLLAAVGWLLGVEEAIGRVVGRGAEDLSRRLAEREAS
jgi:beta-phosphoglucomutase-like phosphatase (HAD superfamily)